MTRNEKGFSLVSVLVALGLTGVLSVILMNLMEQQNKQQKKAIVDGELTEVFAQFTRVLNTKNLCRINFMGLKQGDSFNEFRMDFDPNKDPFAKVGDKFRNTKLTLTQMKILTEAEVTSQGLEVAQTDSEGKTTIVVELTLDRPAGMIGGKQVKKNFDVPVKIGHGQIIKLPSPSLVFSKCNELTGDGCIADFETGECVGVNAVVNAGNFSFGLCTDPTPVAGVQKIILNCW
jgi:type II secretory pathway pseudopilin PulG